MIPGFVQAQDKMATPAQAKELLKKVVAYTKDVGCDKAIAEINNPKGQFKIYANAYPAIGDWNGITLANSKYPFLVGQNHMDLKDVDGKPFIKLAMEKRKKGDNSPSEYRWKDSKTNKIETRTQIGEAYNCGGSRGMVSVSVTYDGKF